TLGLRGARARRRGRRTTRAARSPRPGESSPLGSRSPKAHRARSHPRAPAGCACERPPHARALILRVAAREDRRDVVGPGGRAPLVVAEVLDEGRLDDVDLPLRVLVDARGDERLQLDAVLLTLEELELQGPPQPVVRVPLEALALYGERADEIHD